MDACSPVGAISEDIASCIRTYFSCKLAYLGPKQCAACMPTQENVKIVQMENLTSFEGCLCNECNSKVDDLGTAFSDFHLGDSFSQQDGKQDLPQKDALDGITKKGLSKSATFPCSEKSLISPASSDSGENVSLEVPCLLKPDNRVYTRSNSLPATPKLVSALKGGREREGASPRAAKLTVKWASDVYDPPATSMSHTVNNHHNQRPKTRKKDQQKHKHRHKGKSSRGGVGEKKQRASNHSTPSISSSNSQPSRICS